MPVFEAREQSLDEIFSDAYEFEIPSYQRPYAWGAKQANDLLDDLFEGMACDEDHFLGAIVLVRGQGEPVSSVLDGQQRITTLTILLAVLRDLATDPEIRQEIGEYILQKAKRAAGKKAKPRLTTRPEDRVFLLNNVQTPGGTDGLRAVERPDSAQDRMREVSATLRGRLGAMSEPEREKVCEYLIQRSFVVVMTFENRRSARRIFRVLNARGVDLSTVDILKSTFLDGSTDATVEEQARRWEVVERALGGERFTNLFRLLMESETRDFGADTLDEDFPRRFPAFADPEAFLGKYLEPASELMSFLSNWKESRSPLGAEGAGRLRSLARLGYEGWFPVVLARFLRIPRHAWDQQADFLAHVERVAYHTVVTGVGKAETRNRYEAMCRACRDGGDMPDLTDDERKAFLARLRGQIYEAPYCRAVMLKLDDMLTGNGASYDDPITIEHVLPQTVKAGSEWDRAFPGPIERKRWRAQLGNLVFLTRAANAQASNLPFLDKKEVYISEEYGVQLYALTMSLFKNPAWNMAAFEARQKWLVDLLASAWSLADVTVDLFAQPEPVTRRWRLDVGGEEVANAYERNGEFVVVRGSRCLSEGRGKSNKTRNQLVSDRIIGPLEEGGGLVFRDDASFLTSATASAVVLDKLRGSAKDWREVKGGLIDPNQSAITYAMPRVIADL